MELFDRNLDALTRRDAGLAGRVQGGAAERLWEILPAASGRVTAQKALEGGGTRYIHSRIDPEREADRWAALLSDRAESLAALGFGLGYPVLALRKGGYPGRLIVVESDIELFRIAMQRVDLAAILGDPGIYWLIGEETATVRGVITGLPPGSLSYRAWYPLTDLDVAYYESIRGVLERHIFEFRLREDPSLSRGIERLLSEMVQ